MKPMAMKPQAPTMRPTQSKSLVGPTALAVVLAWAHGPAAAQGAPGAAAPLPAMSAPGKPVFPIRGFDITGDNPLSGSETTRVLAPFLRADGSMEMLQQASAALEAALKQQGYALHRVVLPPQSVGDAVQLLIVKFVVGRITVEGLKSYGEGNIRASLPELKEGSAPNFRTLAVQTAIANESQGKQVQIALKEAEGADQIDARIVVTEAKPVELCCQPGQHGSPYHGARPADVLGLALQPV